MCNVLYHPKNKAVKKERNEKGLRERKMKNKTKKKKKKKKKKKNIVPTMQFNYLEQIPVINTCHFPNNYFT